MMNEKIKNDEIRKFYLCAVHGRMPKRSDTLTAYLKKNSATNLVTISDKEKDGYKNIITKYRVISENNDSSLLEIELVTGRTHQIRAHMAHIGHPLLGDGKYGVNRDDRADGYKYQALYSYRLIFNFKNDEGALGYLSGKQLAIEPKGIWFLENYPGACDKVGKIIASNK